MNAHPGNVRLRTLVRSVKATYLSPRTRKLQKTRIAAEVVRAVRASSDPPGRFLKYDPRAGLWYEIGDQAAVRKAGQALREDASAFRACWRDVLGAEATQKFSAVVAPVRATPATPGAPSGDGVLPRLNLCGENELSDGRMR